MSVASCAGLPTKTVYTPVHTERKAIILEPQNDEMLEAEEGLDLTELPDDLEFEDSIKLNKDLIIEHERLTDKVNDWQTYYRFLVRLNPESNTTVQNEETENNGE